MDFRITSDDRVGAQPRGKANARARGKAPAGRGRRVEPTMGDAVGTFVDDERSGGGASVPPPRKKPVRGKTQKVSKRKRKRRTVNRDTIRKIRRRRLIVQITLVVLLTIGIGSYILHLS